MTGMALAHCLPGKFLGVVCHCFPPITLYRYEIIANHHCVFVPNVKLNDQIFHRGADMSLARPGRKQARKNVRDARDFNNIETRAVIKFVFVQGKAPKGIHAIRTERLACFLPGRAKDLSALMYIRETLQKR